MIETSAVTLERFLNVAGHRLEWVDVFGRKRSLDRDRGGDFAPCPELGKLIAAGKIRAVHPTRGGPIELPNSTDRRRL